MENRRPKILSAQSNNERAAVTKLQPKFMSWPKFGVICGAWLSIWEILKSLG